MVQKDCVTPIREKNDIIVVQQSKDAPMDKYEFVSYLQWNLEGEVWVDIS